MKIAAVHLNLLREAEKFSSSPVRMRVMLPIMALLLCVSVAVWWAVLFMQLLMVKGQISAVASDVDGKKSAHSAILSEMARARDLQAELDQLNAYSAGRHAYGELLARLADVVPARVQLTALSIPEPPPQNLLNPANPRLPPLLGPTGTVEAVSFRITGRTEKAGPVSELLAALEGKDFNEWLVVSKDGPPATQSPLIRPLRQEGGNSSDGRRLLAFDVEFRCPERRFSK